MCPCKREKKDNKRTKTKKSAKETLLCATEGRKGRRREKKDKNKRAYDTLLWAYSAIMQFSCRDHVSNSTSKMNLFLPCQRKIACNIWLCHPGLSWVAKQVELVKEPFLLNPSCACDLYHRPNILVV